MPPLKNIEYKDDGMYNAQWNIYDERGMIFAQAFSQQNAIEVFAAVNTYRTLVEAAEKNNPWLEGGNEAYEKRGQD